MPKLRHGFPLWLDQHSRPHKKFPVHKGTLAVDVVIIGGGITGAIAAYLFSDAGVSVALLESNVVGRGSTVASTALLMQEPDKDFTDLAKRYGSRATRDIWRALAGATRDLARTIRKLKLKCDLRQRDSVYLTLDPDGITELRNEFRKRKRARLPGRWLTAAALYRMTGIRGQAAIVTPGNAEIDPMRACRGFLKAAITRGAKVFERSPARRISPSQKGVSVRTPGGVVHAGCVIVATGYATGEFKPLVGRFRMKDTYVIATRRLPEPLRRKVTRSHAMVWDTDRPYHYTRWTDDGRLLIGGEDTIHCGIRGSQTRITNARSRLLSYLLRMHPELAAEQAFALP